MKRMILFTILSFVAMGALFAQYKSNYPDIPIVDVHIHPNGVEDAANLMQVSGTIQQKYGSNLAFWIGLTDPGESVAEQMKEACNNRILFAASQYQPHKGLTITADEVITKVQNGYPGLQEAMGLK